MIIMKKVYIRESGIILMYLADKFGKFIPSDENRVDTLQWLMWQMSSVGPIFGQAHHFLYYNPGKSEYSELRFNNITNKNFFISFIKDYLFYFPYESFVLLFLLHHLVLS